MRITNNNNDSSVQFSSVQLRSMTIMIIQFVKDEGLPVVLCGHPHIPLQYRKRISASETVGELWFCVSSNKRQLCYSCIL